MDTLPARVAAKIDFTGPCWLWTASKTGSGYGKMWWPSEQRLVPAHRIVYGLLVGPIPIGSELDHLCRTPSCVRPEHLEPVSHRVNMLRGRTAPAAHAAKTACPRGHTYDAVIPSSGKRYCRACNQAQQREQRKRRKMRDKAIVFDGQRYL